VGVTFSRTLQNSVATRDAIRVFSQQRGGLLRDGAGAASTVSGNTVTLDPAADFKPGETLLVTTTAATAANGSAQAHGWVHQFTTAVGGTGRGRFVGGSDVALANNPFSVAIGDVDGDGDLDVLTASLNAGAVSVRLNDGHGGFSGGSEVAVGRMPASVVLGDVDGDGDLDLLTANSATDVVSVRLNGGNASGSNTGLFSGGSSVRVGSAYSAYDIAVGDVDGDGDLDLITANYADNTVSVRLNNGAGVFDGGSETRVTNTREKYYPRHVVVGDVDGDGDLDVVTANTNTNEVSVLLNGGDNTGSNTGVFSFFTEVRAFGGSTQNVALGDVDNNGTLDIIIGSKGGIASTCLNNGSGEFTASDSFIRLSSDFTSLLLGDVDSDGDLDLLTPNDTGADKVNVCLNDGSGVFSSGSTPRVGRAPKEMAVGDLDGDGDLDFLTANSGENATGISVRLNQPQATISSFWPAYGATGTRVTVSGTDLGGSTAVTLDGRPVTAFTVGDDGTTVTFTVPTAVTSGLIGVATLGGVITTATQFEVLTQSTIQVVSPSRNDRATPRSTTVNVRFSFPLRNTDVTRGAVRVYSQQRGGQLRNGLQATTTATDIYTLMLDPATDFRPGETLLVTITSAIMGDGYALPRGQVQQFTTAVGGTGRGRFVGGSDVAIAGSPRSVALGDVDGDGDLDLLAASYNDNTVSVRLNNGNGTFGSAPNVAVGSNPQATALGDVDGDGDLDLLTANSAANTVSVRLNNGNGTFSGGADVAVGASPQGIALGDVDSDGDLDLLVANLFDNSVSVRLNGGNDSGSNTGTFSRGSEVAVGKYAHSVVLGDVDNDGDLDLLAANTNDNTVSIRRNDGYGSFSGGSDVAVGNGPQSVVVGDLDGDGDLDLLAANAGPNTVSVRLNNGSGTFSGSAEVAVGGSPRSVLMGDVDGDGDLDLVAANYTDNTVSVCLNNGAGAFGGSSTVAVGTTPQSLAMGDVDGDGDLDLLTANSGANTVSIRLNQPPPTITSFTPTSGPTGRSVTVSGTDLNGATALLLNGVAVPAFAAGSDGTSLTFVVPAGATSGLLSVTTPGGTATSSTSFTVIPPPTISSFTPTTGPVGTSVKVSGTNLKGATAVTLNGVAVSGFTVDTGGNSFLFNVPAGVTSGPIGVTTPGGSATSSTSFTVITIISFAPNPVNSGTTVTVAGSGLSGATGLTLNGAAVAGFVVGSGGNTLTFVVPATAASGRISVATPGGTATSSSDLLVDNTPPTATLSTTAGSSTGTAPIPFTATFSKGVTGFGAGAISVSNGTLVSGSVSGSGSTYSFTVLPASYRTVVSVSVSAGAARDAATNASLASNNLSVSYDGPPPTADLLNTGTLLTVQAGGILSVGSGGLGNQGGTLTNGGTLRVAGALTNPAAATLDLGAGTLESRGDLSNAGTVRPGSSAVTFSGTTDQLLTPGGGTLYQVLVNKPTAGANTLRLAGDLTVSNGLTLTNGQLTTQNGTTLSTLRLPAGATLRGEASGRYVQGSLAITRSGVSGAAVDFGHGAVLDPTTNNLGTVTITRTAGLQADDVSRSVNIANAAKQGIDRIYTVSAATSPSAAVQLTLGWLPDNDNGLTDFRQASAWQQAAAGQPWVARSPATNASTRSLRFSTPTLGRFTVSNAANPLPVTLEDFTAQAEEPAAVRLRWATAAELNNAGFVVERSLDGRTFAALGSVAGAGTSTQRHAYAWLDGQLPSGAPVLYYRLRQADLNGDETYSPVRSVVFAPRAAGFVVYPTRVATGQALTYLYTGPAAAGQLQVLNVLGQVMSTLALDGRPSGPVPLTGLAQGTYVLRYTGPAGRFVARCVVE
jgi:hypothetical protein